MSVTSILANLVVGFGEEAVKDACEKFLAGEVDAVKSQRRKYKPRGKSSWNVYVEEVLAEMRGTDSEITHKMAMSEASRRRREDNPELEAKYQENKAKRDAKRAAKAAKQAARAAKVEALHPASESEAEAKPAAPAPKPVEVAKSRAKSPEKAQEKAQEKPNAVAKAASKVPLPASAPASAAPSDSESTKKGRGRPSKK
jgi:hypothetical protein